MALLYEWSSNYLNPSIDRVLGVKVLVTTKEFLKVVVTNAWVLVLKPQTARVHACDVW